MAYGYFNGLKKFLLLLFIFIASAFLHTSYAQTTPDQQSDLQKKIAEYQSKLDDAKKQKNTLASQIDYMDSQINLATYRIQDSEEKITQTANEINTLSSRIGKLDSSLNTLSKTLIDRVVQNYKQQGISVFDYVLNSNNANSLLSQMKYRKNVQQNNQRLLVQVQEIKLNFEEQKTLREKKITDLENLKNQLAQQKIELDSQKSAKQKLLAITQNDEKTYQSLLEKSKAEYAAIQTIVTVGSNEIKLADVKAGDSIASIIPGASCNSGGAHTHFIVKENNTVQNPFNYLKQVSFSNCSGSSCGSSDGDSFNPTGSWDWPLSPAIELEQGFGSTWAVRNTWAGRIYSFHDGIDINGASNSVQAVADGTLYKGGFSEGNCVLPYVKLVHTNSTISTYYLHVYSKI